MKKQTIRLTESDLHNMVKTIASRILKEGKYYDNSQITELAEFLENYSVESAKALAMAFGIDKVMEVINNANAQYSEDVLENRAKQDMFSHLNNGFLDIENDEPNHIEYSFEVDGDYGTYSVGDLVFDKSQNALQAPVIIDYTSDMNDGTETFVLDDEELERFNQYIREFNSQNLEDADYDEVD